jgi:fatty-acyl-CoA synthase
MSTAEAPWVEGLTIGAVLAATARRHPETPALVFPKLNYRLTFAEVDREANTLARGLLGLGVTRGEHVGVWSPNRPEWVLLQMAVARIGAVLVHINPDFRASELVSLLRQADVCTLFINDAFRSSSYVEILMQVCPELRESVPGQLSAEALPCLRRVAFLNDFQARGIFTWSQVRAAGKDVPPTAVAEQAALVKTEDIASIQFTSGTTGFPKGAMLTHASLLHNAYHIGARQHFTPRDKLCLPVPLFHCWGSVLGTLASAAHAVTMVFPSEAFDVLATLEAVALERCTALYGAPSMFIALLEHPDFDRFDMSSLRTGIMGSSPCPLEIIYRVIERMGISELTLSYGQTEASPMITQCDTTDAVNYRVGTVGTALPDVEVRLVVPGTLENALGGMPGEILVRGPNVMRGYYKMPDATAAVLTPDGWLRTGDLGTRNMDGFYRITGRLTDMVIRSGQNIYPTEVEDLLMTHPNVAEAYVVGLPDLALGEELSAWVRVKRDATLTAEDLREHCRRQISAFKVPRYIVFVTDFPTTASGKVQKYKLREMGIERFNLHFAARIETA